MSSGGNGGGGKIRSLAALGFGASCRHSGAHRAYLGKVQNGQDLPEVSFGEPVTPLARTVRTLVIRHGH